MGQGQDRPDHVLDLLLVGATSAYDGGSLISPGSVLAECEPGVGGGEKRHSPGLALWRTPSLRWSQKGYTLSTAASAGPYRANDGADLPVDLREPIRR